MLSRIRIYGCAVKLSSHSRPLTSQRRRRRRFEDSLCTRDPWYGFFVNIFFRLIESPTQANIVREVSVRRCGAEVGSFDIGHSQGKAVTTQEYASPSNVIHMELLTIVFCAEDTRYTNPLKQKFKAKRLAAECTNHIQSLHPSIFLIASSQPILVLLPWHGGQTFRCRMNTCHQTRFFSCRTSQKRSQRTNSTRCFLSIPIYTRFVSSRRRKTSPSSNIWTKGAPPPRRMPYTTTNWMGRTRSR